jgi:hypothetical protein
MKAAAPQTDAGSAKNNFRCRIALFLHDIRKSGVKDQERHEALC